MEIKGFNTSRQQQCSSNSGFAEWGFGSPLAVLLLTSEEAWTVILARTSLKRELLKILKTYMNKCNSL